MKNLDKDTLIISVLENIKRQNNDNKHSLGCIILVNYQGTPYIAWRMKKDDSCFLSSLSDDFLKNESDTNTTIIIKTSEIHSLQFGENPYSITIYPSNRDLFKSLRFFDIDEMSICLFIDKLIRFGIASPTIRSPFSLEFYRSMSLSKFPLLSSSICLPIKSYHSLSDIWDETLLFFERLICYIDNIGYTSALVDFPTNSSSRVINDVVLNRIKLEKPDYSNYGMITTDNVGSFFDLNGRIKDFQLFQSVSFYQGVSHSLIKDLLPFFVGIYDSNSTSIDRELQYKELKKEFHRLKQQMNLITTEQLKQNEKLSMQFRTINNDILRTDRNNLAFKSNSSIGLQILSNILKTYAVYDPLVGYLQGMNDLLVPIILAYLPYWNSDSVPVDENGGQIDYEERIPIIFWCFDYMLRITNHIHMLRTVTPYSHYIIVQTLAIIKMASPIVYIWFKINGLQELMWMYSDFVLLFKRTFDDIWAVWIPIITAKNPKSFFSFYVASILMVSFSQLASLPGVSPSNMMEIYPKVLATIDISSVGYVASWLQSNYSLESQFIEDDDADFQKPNYL